VVSVPNEQVRRVLQSSPRMSLHRRPLSRRFQVALWIILVGHMGELTVSSIVDRLLKL
jgi:hypothetical protein